MSATNGGNPRLDRIEKMIEQSLRATKEAERANDKAHAKFKDDLRRWASLGVKEARKHRKWMSESDRRVAKLKQESIEYQRRTDQNLAEITDKLNGLIGFVAGR